MRGCSREAFTHTEAGEHSPLGLAAARWLVLGAHHARSLEQWSDWGDPALHAAVMDRFGVLNTVHDCHLHAEPALAGGFDKRGSANVCSATLSWFAPGVIVTATPCAVAAGMSIRS